MIWKTTMNKTIYVFDCPVHGEESVLFCFRAFDMKNLHLWHKYHVVYEAVLWTDPEKLTYLEELHRLDKLSRPYPDPPNAASDSPAHGPR